MLDHLPWLYHGRGVPPEESRTCIVRRPRAESAPLHCSGFTLVELLVVIGIITVLIALSVPVLSGIREQSRRAQCLGNLHNLVQAAIAYSLDNEGQLPYSNVDYGTPKNPGWAYSVDLQPDPALVETGTLWPYLRDRRVYHCPLDDSQPLYGPAQFLTSYLMSSVTTCFDSRPTTYRIPQMRPDGILFWEGNEQSRSAWHHAGSWPWEGLPSRHNNGGCIACFDGRSQYMSYTDLLTEDALRPSRLWCAPDIPRGYP